MGAVATFDYDAWVGAYPEFSFVAAAQAQGYFDQAALLWRNDGCGPVRTAAQQLTILNMLTAHVAALFAARGPDQPATTLVGRISQAGEGSVNVSAESEFGPGTPQWFQQTKYGAMFWAATAAYRTMRYVPAIGRGVGGVAGAASLRPGALGSGGSWWRW